MQMLLRKSNIYICSAVINHICIPYIYKIYIIYIIKFVLDLVSLGHLGYVRFFHYHFKVILHYIYSFFFFIQIPITMRQ